MAKRHLTPDEEIGRLLEHRLQRTTAPAGEVCADAETLASYVDDGMSAAERADWETHFATCAKCRRALALMARLKETAVPDGERTIDPTSTRGNPWVWVPLAACVLVGAGLWFATRPADRPFTASNGSTAATEVAAREDRVQPTVQTPPAPAPTSEPKPTTSAPAVPATGAKAAKTGEYRQGPPSAGGAPAVSDAAAPPPPPAEAFARRAVGATPGQASGGSAAGSVAGGAAAEQSLKREVDAGRVADTRTSAPAKPVAQNADRRADRLEEAERALESQRKQAAAARGVSGPSAQQAQASGQSQQASVQTQAQGRAGALSQDRKAVDAVAAGGAAPVSAPASSAESLRGEANEHAKEKVAANAPAVNAAGNVNAVNAAGTRTGGPANVNSAGTSAVNSAPVNSAATPAPAVEVSTAAAPPSAASSSPSSPSSPAPGRSGGVAEGFTLQGALKDDAAKLRERDAISPADRAAGMVAIVTDAKNASRRWRVFKFGRIETTTDGGGSWRDAMPPVGITFSAAATPAPGVCWVVGTKGGVWHLEAQSWQARAVPTDEDLVAVAAGSAREAVVTTRSGQRFATNDGGRSWARQQ